MKKFFSGLLFLTLASLLRAQSNEGTRFHFTFLEHIDAGRNNMVVMITSKTNTSGKVEMPLQGWQQSFTVAANQVTLVPLPRMAETIGSEAIAVSGVRVTSDRDVSVYIHQYFNFRSEASAVLPDEALGNDYYAIAYRSFRQGNTVYPAEFAVVGVKDDTEIEITLSDATRGGRKKGDKINVVLGPGQVYQVQTLAGNAEITGSRIRGNKPFAVFAGNSWTPMPADANCEARDNLLEQMYPISTWGKEFVSVLSAQVTYDVFRIFASQNNTTVLVQGTTTDTLRLQEGQFAEYRKGESTYITADKPIAVAQFNVGGQCGGNPNRLGDPSMVLLNSVEQIRDTVTLYNSAFQAITENYLNVVALATDIGKVTLDGTPLANISGAIGTLAGNKKYSFARLRVSAGSHTLISGGCGISVTAYGYGNAESYAYNGGASFKPINASPLPEGGCLNDSILFNVGLPPPRFSLFWDFGRGDTSRQHILKRAFPQTGLQPVLLAIRDVCLKKEDTIRGAVNITLPNTLAVPDRLRVCEKDTLFLQVNDKLSEDYFWTGPAGFSSKEKNPFRSATLPAHSGNYAVRGILDGCLTLPAAIWAEVTPTPKPWLGADATICPIDPAFDLRLTAGFFQRYTWQDGSTLPYFDVDMEGKFSVRVWDQWGCTGTDTLLLARKCPTKIFAPTAFSPNSDGVNDRFLLLGDDVLSLEWRVFDRWGNVVFHTTQKGEGWDGRFRGKDLDPGTYVWMARLEGYRRNGKIFVEERSGAVSLFR